MRRRRVRDRLDCTAPEERRFSAEQWCDDLGQALSEFPVGQPRTWQLRRDRLRRLIGVLRNAVGDLPSDTSAAIHQLTLLELALASLNVGEVHPLLVPAPAGNRHPDSAAQDQFRRVVLQCCVHLIASSVPRTEAYRIVADELTKRGQGSLKKPGQPFSAATAKRWHAKVELGDTGVVEATGDDRWLNRFALNMVGTSKGDALSNVRHWLDDPRVRDIFPEVRKGGVLTH